ncbi:hypothetical protein [Absidia glauca]|uniref:Uncharacterized protein n=1 Tax=Absidia glauca TaxID=4829 RepID=A0A163JXZ1_ABSGL|nr:hypothetical protein [Absidia glauca]
MHRHTLALFFSLVLLSVTVAKTDEYPGLNDHEYPGLIDDEDPGLIDDEDPGLIDDEDPGLFDNHSPGLIDIDIFGLGGFGEERESLRGKPCRSVRNCGFGSLYCIDNICQEKQPGRDCLAEGSFYTGGKNCCSPMANPHQVNTPCRMISTSSCKDDRDCSIRNGWQNSKCCPNYSNGNGVCMPRTKKC